jgi:hypothetical protein
MTDEAPNASHLALRSFLASADVEDPSMFRRWRHLCASHLHIADQRGHIVVGALTAAASVPGNRATTRALVLVEMAFDVIAAMESSELDATAFIMRIVTFPVVTGDPPSASASASASASTSTTKHSLLLTCLRARVQRADPHPQYLLVRDKVVGALVDDALRRADFRWLPWVFAYGLVAPEVVLRRYIGSDLEPAAGEGADRFHAGLVAVLPSWFMARLVDPAHASSADAMSVLCDAASTRARAGLYGALFERAMRDTEWTLGATGPALCVVRA